VKRFNLHSKRRPALVLSMLAGSSVSILGLLPQPVHSQQPNADVPTVIDPSHLNIPKSIPILDAQKAVSFPIFVPADVPNQATIEEARVLSLDIPAGKRFDPKIQSDQIRQHSHLIGRPSYGVYFDLKGPLPMARSIGGSPAEKAGLPDEEVRVISVDFVSTGLNQSEVIQLGTKEPMIITFLDTSGKLNSVTIPHRENFMFHPDVFPVPPKSPFDKYAIVYLKVHGKQLAVEESPVALRTFLPSPPAYAQYTDVAGRSAAFIAPEASPSVYWNQDGIDFWFNNSSDAVNKDELIAMISSMHRLVPPQPVSSDTGNSVPK
jgi:hypothetical protein